MVEEVSFLKKDFKQKENKYIADFLDIKTLKEKVEDKLIKQDQSLQTVHKLCRPRPNSNALNRVAIGYKNPLCLTRAKQVQPALCNGHKIIKDNHTPAIVHNSKDTLEIAEITRKKMNDKMNDPECMTRKALTKELKEMKDVFEELEAEVAQYAVDRKHDAIELKNLLIANDNLIAECLSQEVFCMEIDSELNVARFTEMHVANTTAETRCLALEAELANLRETNNHDNQKELINHFPNLRAENDKIKQHYKELYDSIKITRAKHIKQVTKLTAKNVMLKTSVGKAKVQPPVLTRTMHAVDVEPIVPRLRNNRDAHLDYLRHLKESVETIRDIVEEAKVVRPLDRSIVSACRKKQVTVAKPSDKSDSTTHRHVVTLNSQKTNVHVPPSTGVNNFPNASGSQPKRHVKAHRISPAKDKMADVNAPSGQTPTLAPPVRADDQIVPHIRWVPIGKSNCYLDLEKSQSNPIYKIAMDLLKNTNFLKRKHKFHPRPDSPLHLSNEEPVLGYLKFSAKGTKSEVFSMPIPDSLITSEIQQATYYQEYLAKPAPTSAPAKSQENKRKQATETTDKPAKAKRIKCSISRKTRQPIGSPKSVGASEAEEVPAEEPQVADEDVDYQKAVEESMKDAYALPKGKGKAKVTEEQVAHDLLSLQKHKKTSHADQYIFQRRVSEPTGSSGYDESPYALLGQSDNEEESEKVVLGAEEGGQDEGRAGPDPDTQAEDQTGSDAGAQPEGQAGSNPDETSEGQAGPNPDETSKGQAGPDHGDAEAKVQSISSPVVHAGSDREHMDLDVADVSPQPSTEQLDEGFTATVYPNVQENLKLAVEKPVLLQEPASSSGTLSSLQHLSRDFSFGDQLFSDKHSDADKNAETKVKSMVNVTIQQALSLISLMTSPIIDLTSRPESPKEHQQLKATTTDTTTTITTTLPPPQAPQQSTTEAMMVKRIAMGHVYTLEQLDKPQRVSIDVSEVVTEAVEWAMQAPLRNRFRDLPEADMKEILHQRMWESDSYKSHEDHMQLFEALEKSMNRDHSEELVQDLAEVRKKKKKSRKSPKTPPGSPSHQPPPPPPPAGPSGASGAPRGSGSAQMQTPPPLPSSTNQESPSKGSIAPSPLKTAASAEYQAWTTTDIRLRPSISLTPADLEIDKDMAPDEQAQSSDDEDIESAHILTVNLRQGWWKPFEEERPTTLKPAWSILSSDTDDIATFMDWFCKRRGITELKPQDLERPAYEIVKVFHPDRGRPHTKAQRQQTTTTGGPPDLEYLRYSSKGRRPALSISKIKAAYYLDAGLEQMVPDQFWIEEQCKYDIAAMY
nr:hypothetical protein [Tanacetum cinerariifolium]